MCGIAGYLTTGGFREAEAIAVAQAMGETIAHRGPDDSGFWLDPDAGIVLIHRRLAIVDLSAAGHQPMVSSSGRYVLVFNGEIYNHLSLRAKLQSSGERRWRGNSDTESLLVAIDDWGLDRALQESVGMFALALWDLQTRCLSLARDRMGEKPLYYGWQGKTLLFGSELKALRVHPDFVHEIEQDVLPLYLHHGYIPGPWSIWRGIRKLSPGCVIDFFVDQPTKRPEPIPYWTLVDVINAARANPFQGSEAEAITALESCLSEAVGGQMVADVPVGILLSGGIDSSTMVSLMQARSQRPVKTFTLGFAENGYDEAIIARQVAACLGTDHTELYVQVDHARDVIPKLPHIYDEPFGDSSAIPMYLVSHLAKRHVTVALSGDGGDELFGGYDRYPWVYRLWCRTRRLPRKLCAMGGCALRFLAAVDAMDRVCWLLGARRDACMTARMLYWANYLDTSSDVDMLSQHNSSRWPKPLRGAQGVARLPPLLVNPVERMMAIDMTRYLPDDILFKVDRASMSASLEIRVPLLDHRVVELAWRMPYSMKLRAGQGKWLLRQILYRHVPRYLIDRPKMGFGVPVGVWLRGPLRDWAEELLSEHKLEVSGLPDPQFIRHLWSQCIAGSHNWRDTLWTILMWQAWIQNASPRTGVPWSSCGATVP
ncbi:MAG: asparagine synthase (glutamine-hydrolyzing) [Desulfobulbaceae bacterium A2]|nr:MAG: asparagine synthase (glutamine-hydrolyzing) [Desulfobulbaceae bacterium A2]